MKIYDPIPPVDQIDDGFLLSIARKGFVRAGLSPQLWRNHWDDARQVAWLSMLESQGQHDGNRIGRAKWAVFEYVITQIYGQQVGGEQVKCEPLFPEITAPTVDDDQVEWTLVVKKLMDVLPMSSAAIAVLLLRGKSNYEIAESIGLANEDSARALVSRTRRRINQLLEGVSDDSQNVCRMS